ncbi:hypothetical protein, partial [Acinetobacter baumannii]|uniref:hypothetical protein n=1 Tax=Acinetobacter baumannii TaxID=470 RepID=UPI003399C86B
FLNKEVIIFSFELGFRVRVRVRKRETGYVFLWFYGSGIKHLRFKIYHLVFNVWVLIFWA